MFRIVLMIYFLIFISCQHQVENSHDLFGSPEVSDELDQSKNIEEDNSAGANVTHSTESEEETSKEDPKSSESNKEAFELKVILQSVFYKLECILIPRAYASDRPYCNSNCKSNNCLYLIQIDREKEIEEILCSIDNHGQDTRFVIHQLKYSEKYSYEVRTFEEEVNIENENKSDVFTISHDEMITNGKSVYPSKVKFQSSFFVKDDIHKKDFNITKAYQEYSPEIIVKQYVNLIEEEPNQDLIYNEDVIDDLYDSFITKNISEYNFVKHLKAGLFGKDRYSQEVLGQYISDEQRKNVMKKLGKNKRKDKKDKQGQKKDNKPTEKAKRIEPASKYFNVRKWFGKEGE